MKESKNTAIEYKGWHVVRRIGTGSFGSVYEIEREDFGYQIQVWLLLMKKQKVKISLLQHHFHQM